MLPVISIRNRIHSFDSFKKWPPQLPEYLAQPQKQKSTNQSMNSKDLPVAFASRSSTSGYLIPVWDLWKRGLVGPDTCLPIFFSLTIYGTGYVSAVEKVLSGEVEARRS